MALFFLQGKQGKKQGLNEVLRKNHKLKSGTYYDYLVIAIIADPLQKSVRIMRSCSQRKRGIKQGMNQEKS